MYGSAYMFAGSTSQEVAGMVQARSTLPDCMETKEDHIL